MVEAEVLSRVSRLEDGQAKLREDVAKLTSEISYMRNDLSELRRDLRTYLTVTLAGIFAILAGTIGIVIMLALR